MNNIKKLVATAYTHLDKGNIDSAENILDSLSKLERTFELNYSIGALLIEIGTASKNMEHIDEGIKIFEELKIETTYDVDYNLGNGYLSKYKIMAKKPNYLTKEEHLLTKAKKYYLNCLNNPQLEQLPLIYTNLGNLYNHIGRTIDALEYYEKAPDNPYVLINKGIGMCSYSTFINNPAPILKDAYEYFKKVLKIENIPIEFKSICDNYMKIIENYNSQISEQKIDKKFTKPSNDTFEGFITNFCLNNQLYLNLCNFCQRCENSIGDTVIIPNMLVKIGTTIEEDPYLKLSSQLNQIKLDYVTSRFLLILSQSNGDILELITKNTVLTESLSYEENSSSVQLLKNSFTSFYNILDKISNLINIYFKLKKNPKHLNFHNVWNNRKGKINRKLRNLNNLGLNALYDIHLELEQDQEKFYLREMRNNLTHNFIPIKLFKLEKNEITYEELRDNTIELAKIVKNAIIYLIRAIKINEEKRLKQHEDEFIPKMHSKTVKYK